ncbi:hypothetical protein GOV04_00700 [Candidatus Woesearchaeota archaeon]|nr:hypothetical protein [Candidatus Woesearchaeota archaeon]
MLKEATKAFNLLKSNLLQWVLAGLGDFLFLFFSAVTTSIFFSLMIEKLRVIVGVFETMQVPSTDAMAAEFSQMIATNAELAVAYQSFLWLLAGLTVSLFILCLGFNGLAYFYTYKLSKSKISLKQFFKFWFLYSVVWALIFTVLFAVMLNLMFYNSLLPFSVLTDNFIGIVFVIIGLFFGYHMFYSFLVMDNKQKFLRRLISTYSYKKLGSFSVFVLFIALLFTIISFFADPFFVLFLTVFVYSPVLPFIRTTSKLLTTE